MLAIPAAGFAATGFERAAPPGGLPDGFRFLFAFDYLSVFDRKNPLARSRRSARAFAAGSGAVLIVKCAQRRYDPGTRAAAAAAAAHPDVYLLAQG